MQEGTITAIHTADVNGDGYLDLLAAFHGYGVWVFFGTPDIATLRTTMEGADIQGGTFSPRASEGDGALAPTTVLDCTSPESKAMPVCRLTHTHPMATDITAVHGEVHGPDAQQHTWVVITDVCASLESGSTRCPGAPVSHVQWYAMHGSEQGSQRVQMMATSVVPITVAPVGNATSTAPQPELAFVVGGVPLPVGLGGTIDTPAVQLVYPNPNRAPQAVPTPGATWAQHLVTVDSFGEGHGCAATFRATAHTGTGRVLMLPGAGPHHITEVAIDKDPLPTCLGTERPCYRLREDGRTVEVLTSSQAASSTFTVTASPPCAQDLVVTHSGMGGRSFLLHDRRPQASTP